MKCYICKEEIQSDEKVCRVQLGMFIPSSCEQIQPEFELIKVSGMIHFVCMGNALFEEIFPLGETNEMSVLQTGRKGMG